MSPNELVEVQDAIERADEIISEARHLASDLTDGSLSSAGTAELHKLLRVAAESCIRVAAFTAAIRARTRTHAFYAGPRYGGIK